MWDSAWQTPDSIPRGAFPLRHPLDPQHPAQVKPVERFGRPGAGAETKAHKARTAELELGEKHKQASAPGAPSGASDGLEKLQEDAERASRRAAKARAKAQTARLEAGLEREASD